MDRLCLAVEENNQIGGALQRRAPADAEEMAVEHAFLTRSDPGQVIGKRRMVGEEIIEARALEDA